MRTNLFAVTSRYHHLETAVFTTPDGKKIIHLKRRFLPPSSRFSLLQEHIVNEGERLDNITAQYLGDPEQFWRLADANDGMHPNDLTETVGGKIRITLPEGIPGNTI